MSVRREGGADPSVGTHPHLSFYRPPPPRDQEAARTAPVSRRLQPPAGPAAPGGGAGRGGVEARRAPQRHRRKSETSEAAAEAESAAPPVTSRAASLRLLRALPPHPKWGLAQSAYPLPLGTRLNSFVTGVFFPSRDARGGPPPGAAGTGQLPPFDPRGRAGGRAGGGPCRGTLVLPGAACPLGPSLRFIPAAGTSLAPVSTGTAERIRDDPGVWGCGPPRGRGRGPRREPPQRARSLALEPGAMGCV